MAFLTATPLLSTSTSSFTPSACSAIPIRPARPTATRPIARPSAPRMARDERTFVAVKPDGMNRGLLGNILSRFEAKGYKLVAIKVVVPSKETAQTHYAALSEKPFFNDLVDFIVSGPVCAMIWEGDGVVKGARNLIGQTNPADSAPGTIRGDFGIDIGRKYVAPFFSSPPVSFLLISILCLTKNICVSSFAYYPSSHYPSVVQYVVHILFCKLPERTVKAAN